MTIAGSNFVPGATVSFGGVAAGDTAVTAGAITATTPAGSAGAADVTVTNPGLPRGNAGATLRQAFTYAGAAPPAISTGPAPAAPAVAPTPDPALDAVTRFAKMTGPGQLVVAAASGQGQAPAETLGGHAEAIAPPVDIHLQGSNAGASFELGLPVLSQPPTGVFAWLQASYDASGQFAGWLRPASRFDASTGLLWLRVNPRDLVGTLFLPVTITPSWVQNFEPTAHVYSGPNGQAADFGLAGPQFTTLTVVAPPFRGRLYVYDPAVSNYVWIDAAAVGPSGPP